MYTNYYNKQTKRHTQINHAKRVLIKHLRAVSKVAGYTVLAGLTYLVLVGLTV